MPKAIRQVTGQSSINLQFEWDIFETLVETLPASDKIYFIGLRDLVKFEFGLQQLLHYIPNALIRKKKYNLYRDINHAVDIRKQIINPQFMSTSRSIDISEGFGRNNAVLKIEMSTDDVDNNTFEKGIEATGGIWEKEIAIPLCVLKPTGVSYVYERTIISHNRKFVKKVTVYKCTISKYLQIINESDQIIEDGIIYGTIKFNVVDSFDDTNQ